MDRVVQLVCKYALPSEVRVQEVDVKEEDESDAADTSNLRESLCDHFVDPQDSRLSTAACKVEAKVRKTCLLEI